jgi:hypothetical protein
MEPEILGLRDPVSRLADSRCPIIPAEESSNGRNRDTSTFSRAVWLVVLLVVVVQAALLALSRVHTAHDSDTLLWTLISVDRLVPFYWNDNRTGTLIPWLTTFIRDSYANTQVQVFIWSVSVIACPLLIGRLTFRTRQSSALTLALLALAYALLCGLFRFDSPSCLQILFLGHPHALALCLALTAILVAQSTEPKPSSLFALLILGFLTAWINIGLIVFLVVAILLMGPITRRNGRPLWQIVVLGAICAAASAEYAFSRLYSGTEFLIVGGLSRLPETLIRLCENSFALVLRPGPFCLVLLIALSIFALRKYRAPLLLDYRRVLSLTGAVLVLCMATGYSGWPALNAYHPRYLAAPAIAVCILISLAAADALLVSVKAFQWPSRILSVIAFILFGLVLALELIAFGLPSPTNARRALESQISVDRLALEAAGCTHLIGSYSFVWSRVFDYNAAFPDRRLWGIAPRAEATRDLWDNWPQTARVYCAFGGDLEVLRSAARFGIPELVPTGTFANIRRLGPVPKTASPYKYGQILRFTKNGTAAVYQAEGWGRPESDWTWTVGNRSSLLLSLPHSARSDLVMTFEAHAFTPPHDHRPVSLLINGQTLAHWDFDTSEPVIRRRIKIPKERASDRLEITFINHRPLSPAEAGVSADTRKLSIALHTMMLDEE